MSLQTLVEPTPPPPPGTLPKHDVDLVAQLTGLSPATVRRRCNDATFPHSRFGNAIRFSDRDIEKILADARTT